MNLESLTKFVSKDPGLEFWIEKEEGKSLEKREGKVFLEERYEDQNLTVRYLNPNGKAGLSYTTSLEETDVILAINKAKVLSEQGMPASFPEEKPSEFTSPQVCLPTEDFSSILAELEEEALRFERIKKVEKIKLSWGKEKIALLRKDLVLIWEAPFYTFFISVVACDNSKEASSYEWFEGRSLEKKVLKQRVKEACLKASLLSQAKKGEPLKVPVLFPSFLAIDLLEILEFSFLGDEVIKGRSFLKDKLGKPLFSENLTLVDDGLTEGLVETRPFDDEGAPQNIKVLIDRGVVNGYLFDSYWKKQAEAMGLGVFSAGNARRPDFKNSPKVSATNLYFKEGSYTKEELLSFYPQVFEVLELLGAHTADPISGEFSVGVSGVYYKNGEPVKVLSEMALSGNIFEMLKQVVAVGKDLRFYGSLGSPTLLIENIDLGG
ncbi:TldD/PmbA family protein [Thermodesulfobacterium sp. TA1]|uniref:TldD/PmbA family protein n=1 Tax=Thermodesulfobacterium sp. TA1 TaxID=2234087 RepID=UPI001232841A|nr:metallopeptidase TldD-related protein [Thermodesulfobacterium sp. TA1]QER41211.1 TldD/PmbA family protein [Thermodesulfobacterium sp. TA1]